MGGLKFSKSNTGEISGLSDARKVRCTGNVQCTKFSKKLDADIGIEVGWCGVSGKRTAQMDECPLHKWWLIPVKIMHGNMEKCQN